MTRKHFKALAEGFAAAKDVTNDPEQMRQVLALVVATVAADTNELFDVARFLRACDIE